MSFVTMFLSLCPYFSLSSLYHFSLVLAPTFIFVIVIFFFSVIKLNDISFFLDFRRFFGLQLISFNLSLVLRELRVCLKAFAKISF